MLTSLVAIDGRLAVPAPDGAVHALHRHGHHGHHVLQHVQHDLELRKDQHLWGGHATTVLG